MYKKSNGFSKPLIMVLLFLAVLGAGLYFKTDYLQQAKAFLDKQVFNSSSNHQMVTFYQWTSPDGEVIVSRSKPNYTENFISFQASADLMTNDHQIDPNLLTQSQDYREQVLQGDTPATKRQTSLGVSATGATSATSGTILGAPAKVKHCVNAAMQQGVANRKAGESGQKGTTSRAKGC